MNFLGSRSGAERCFEFGARVTGHDYKVSVIKSLEFANGLLRSILLIVFSTILVMLIASNIINRFLLRRLWKPFYETLNKLKLFSLTNNETLHFQPTNIEEFNLMNAELETATRRAQQDYGILKEFTENASHEMQTPLAIIRSKLDVLIQDEHLSETQSISIQNENIIIPVSLKEAMVKMNKELSDILLNNLLSNATKHNFSNGSIQITLEETGLTISNTSQSPALDENRLFTRFYIVSEGMGHHGLGLSIIKQICDSSEFTIRYNYHDQLHSFVVTW